MILYILYIFIINELNMLISPLFSLGLIKLVFFNANNKTYLLFLFTGIIIKLVTKVKSKALTCKYVYLFILIDIIKYLLVKYSIITYVISLIISLVLNIIIKHILINNKIIRWIILLFTIIFPLSILIYIRIDNKMDIHKVSVIYLLGLYIFLAIYTNPLLILNISYISLIKGFIILMFSFNLTSINNKRRNILTMFLLGYLIYYIL